MKCFRQSCPSYGVESVAVTSPGQRTAASGRLWRGVYRPTYGWPHQGELQPRVVVGIHVAVVQTTLKAGRPRNSAVENEVRDTVVGGASIFLANTLGSDSSRSPKAATLAAGAPKLGSPRFTSSHSVQPGPCTFCCAGPRGNGKIVYTDLKLFPHECLLYIRDYPFRRVRIPPPEQPTLSRCSTARNVRHAVELPCRVCRL